MTFEEFEKANPNRLRTEAQVCFDNANANPSWGGAPTLLLQAQFYMMEMDRRNAAIEQRRSDRIGLRDLLLEIAVIILIAVEIGLAVKQGKDEDLLMGKQNGILTNLQTSTAENAKSIGALATIIQTMSDSTAASGKTLTSLRATTETMNQAVHDQVDLFYDPSVNLTYTSEPSRVIFSNTGRSEVSVVGMTIDGNVSPLDAPKLIAVSANYYFEFPQLYKNLSVTLPKGNTRTLPITAILKNERGRTFLFTGALFAVWDGDKLVIHSQPASLVPTPQN